VTSNVEAAVKRFGIEYPVVQDNDFATWNAYSNQYWPAEYLIDKHGRVRHVHFGEGSYGETEADIARLLDTSVKPARRIADATPTEATTPETYLGYRRLERYAGSALVPGRASAYRFPAGQLAQNALAYGGTWNVGADAIVASAGARLRIHVHAKNVYIVLGGRGRVDALFDGKAAGHIAVDGSRLYTVRTGKTIEDGVLELRFTPGVRGYSFTFG
jgi:Thioredoxin like C-terminal domain